MRNMPISSARPWSLRSAVDDSCLMTAWIRKKRRLKSALLRSFDDAPKLSGRDRAHKRGVAG